MKRIPLLLLAALVSFGVGIASATIWIAKHRPAIPPLELRFDCTPEYDARFVSQRKYEEDDPKLFAAFQEPPLYAMPDCVDEAYSLTWIPSFHPAVLVQLWRSGDRSFMVAKELDTKGWSGNIKAMHSRALTAFEWRDFTDLLKRSSFWDLPSTIAEEMPNDGAVWVVDGHRAREFHWVRRRIPDEQLAKISNHLIRLSGLETAYSLYLPEPSR
jgi:hypothetical protein